jgi:tetratricopeptide (TPR) repeat protein
MRNLILVVFGLTLACVMNSASGADNNSVKATIAHAKEYLDNNQPEEAIKLLDDVIEKKPSNTEALCLKGESLSKQEKYEEAIKFYDLALSTNRKYVDALKGRCKALCSLNRGAEFYDCSDTLSKIDDPKIAADALRSSSCPTQYHGNTKSDSEIYNKALELYNLSIARNSNDTASWNNKGIALGELDRLNESIACFDNAIKINSSFAEAWNNKGVSLDKMGRHQEALESYNRSLKINLRLAEAWYNKGINLGLTEMAFKDAQECYSNATELDPKLKENETSDWIYKET